MDLSLGDEHRMIRDMARDFAQNEIAPIAAHHLIDSAPQDPHRQGVSIFACQLAGLAARAG